MTRHGTPPAKTPARLARLDFHHCSTCGKRAYHSRKAAKAARTQLGDSSLHLYRCDAGNLHLGHMAPGQTRDVYRARRRRARREEAS